MSAVTPTHQRVQAAPASGLNLSAGLKNRLKRCGRYHSATPSAKKPCIATSWSPGPQLASRVALPVTPQDSHQASVSRGDNSNTPKPLSSCSRRMRTSLSFKSPVMKTEGHGSSTGPAEGVGAPGTRWSETSRDECGRELDPSTPLSSKHKRLSQSGNKSRLKFSSDLDKINQQSAYCDQTGLHSSHINDKTGTQSVGCSDDSIQRPLACCDKTSIQSLDCSHKSIPQSVGCSDKPSPQSIGCSDIVAMRREKKDLTLHLTAAEEKLRKLNMVKMYRSKNNLQQLQCLIDKWRGVTHQALSDLHSLLPQPRPSLPDFVKHLQIDTDLVQLDLEEED